jgi:hypothetical protein
VALVQKMIDGVAAIIEIEKYLAGGKSTQETLDYLASRVPPSEDSRGSGQQSS